MAKLIFTLTATQMDGIDAAAVTVATLSTNASAARVPKSLVVMKAAGDVYTVNASAKILVRDDDSNVLFSFPATGFLDSAAVQGRYVEAATSGRAFKSGGTDTFTVDALGSIAKGSASPDVKFILEYEEYKIVD